MPDDEGLALHRAARQAAARHLGPLLEVGACCGKSTVYRGIAAAEGLRPRPSRIEAKNRTPAAESDRRCIVELPSKKALRRSIESRGG